MERKRDSNIELFRIVTMILIVAHHYVIHSGLLPLALGDFYSAKSLFVLLLGAWGKIGINCFVLITGYFMCTKQISFRKFLKLFLPFYFYKIIIFLIFAVSGSVELSPRFILSSILPFVEVKDRFLDCYLLFFCFIPVLNILISNITKRQFQLLLGLCLLIYSIFPSIGLKLSYSHVSWYMVVFLIAAYLRLYLPKIMANTLFVRLGLLCSLVLCSISVIAGSYVCKFLHMGWPYMFVMDSVTPLAVATSIFAFLFFKTIQISYNRVINVVASSTFGVLLIHDNCRTIKEWLWIDLLECEKYYANNIYLHAIISIICVYVVCTLIDFVRIRCLEKSFFSWYDKRKGMD